MTIFAVMCAGVFPLLHMGRPWLFYWLFPFPNNFGMWPQFRSPLAWDVFAVSTYFTVSVVFWYVGLIPDFAVLRETSPTKIQKWIYGMLSMGWRGSAYHWRRYEKVYLILAGISTPLVFSVHSVVSFDFAVAIVPLWHATIFPPFFVIGAIFSGFAMVLVLAIPLRKWYHLEDFITDWHIDCCAKIMLATGHDGLLRLLQRTVDVVVQPQRIRVGHDEAAHVRALWLVVLVPDLLQLRHAADPVGEEVAVEPARSCSWCRSSP